MTEHATHTVAECGIEIARLISEIEACGCECVDHLLDLAIWRERRRRLMGGIPQPRDGT